MLVAGGRPQTEPPGKEGLFGKALVRLGLRGLSAELSRGLSGFGRLAAASDYRIFYFSVF